MTTRRRGPSSPASATKTTGRKSSAPAVAKQQAAITKSATSRRTRVANDLVDAASAEAATAVTPTVADAQSAIQQTGTKVADRPSPNVTTQAQDRWVRQACKMTEREYDALTRLKRRAGQLARPMRRSELLRAGVQALARLDDVELFEALDAAAIPRR